jgi:hypothetical protein
MRAEAHADLSDLWWDPDERAAEKRYNDRSKEEVEAALDAAAATLAGELAQVGAGDWTRVGVFPWGERDLLIMARNAAHEGAHHLKDIKKQLEA